MVVRNVDRFLGEAIESILGQTFKEFEFIIVDFGSTDRSKAIILEYQGKDSRIKFHPIPPCGLGEARNAAGFLAQGRYIAIMDADDIAVRDRLTWQIDFMEKHPEVGVLGGAVEYITCSQEVNDAADRVPPIAAFPVEDREIRASLYRCPFWQPTVLLRTEAFASVGGYRPAFAPAEDYDLWLRIGERFQLANLERVVLKYRIHQNQVSQRKLRQQTLSFLAARAAASSRRDGTPDPLNSVKEITPEVLAGLGVSEADLQRALAHSYTHWIYNSTLMSQHSAAFDLAMEMLGSSTWKYADRRTVADLRLLVARVRWRQKKWLQSFLGALRAVITRPVVIGRPLRPLWRWLRLALKGETPLSPLR
jgi:glycosyltransferase involved in cell wall biosynthesis